MSNDDIVSDALNGRFFEGMTDDERAALADHAEPEAFDADTFLFRQGGEADAFWVIMDGRVALEVADPRGAKTIQTLRPGQVVGFSWLFEPHDWKFDARAIGEVTAVRFDGIALRELTASDHELGYELLRRFAQIVVKRLQETRVKALDLYA